GALGSRPISARIKLIGVAVTLRGPLFGLGQARTLWLRRAAPQLSAALVLWIWVAFYFGWQGAQFAITMRYLLPVYGALIVFAAWLLVVLWDRRAARTPQWRRVLRWALPLVVLATFIWAYAFSRIYTRPHSRVQAAQWVLQHVPPGSTITSEVWDDPLPLQVGGFNPWGSSYEGISTAPYAEDEPRKFFGDYKTDGSFEEGLIDQLDRADYVSITSNRIYDSTARLPMRYPATMRYYQYLFNGELGFELVAEFTSYPNILSIEIPDQRAEEAFTVYDHPKVLIFQKTARYNRERAAELLTGEVNWQEVYKSPVHIADRNQQALRLTESVWPSYRAGGTWADAFASQSITNTLAPLIWLLVLELLGLAMFALLFNLLPWLPDRGFAFAKTLGLLVVAYAAWLLGSLKLAPFTSQTLWLCALPLLLLGAISAHFSWERLRAFWHLKRRAILSAEAIFVGFFLLGLLLRWFNPDLWHPARAARSPWTTLFFNAVLKSAAFPPYDPWHAGGYINYYYFGFVSSARGRISPRYCRVSLITLPWPRSLRSPR
ncbi:hypothetical protein HC891_24180, partial [Candidatus Gracilibacteria bacterium]|nr:hypothetical protein [Candidatus Gracilibacteria bacterium]